MSNQNKAHAVNVGSVYKPMGKSGLINVASNGAIINHFGADATGNSIHAVGVGKIGYNAGSKNLCSAPPLKKAVLFYPQIQSIRPKWACRFAVFGGVWYRQRPRCHRQLEHPHPFLMVAINLKTCGGIMPKKSTVAIATSQTQSQTFTAGQAIQRHTDTTPITDYFCGVVQPSKWYRRDLEPSPVFTMGKAVAL